MELKNEIIAELGANYNSSDSSVIETLLEDTITNALTISNRVNTLNNVNLLKNEIKKCVKALYLQRGVEDTTNRTESGLNLTFIDAIEEMRNNIIKNGKRVVF